MMASSAGKPPQEPGKQILPGQQRELPPLNFYSSEDIRAVPELSVETRPTLLNGHSRKLAKPPLPPKARTIKASDSELSDLPEEDAGSNFSGGEAAESEDFSEDSAGSKRKRGSKQVPPKRFRTPEDNDMRRKLRATAPQEDASRPASADRSHVSETEANSEFEEEDDPTAVPERVVPTEAEQEQKEMLKTSWELVAVLDFLSIFQPYLNIHHLQFGAEELESALVLNNGTSGLLMELHIGLLKGISSRANLHSGNWPASLAEKLKVYWRTGHLSGRNPFTSQRRREAATYATLPVEDRVTALRILCELRLEREDLHNVVEHALHPPRKTKAEKKAEALAIKAGRKIESQPVMPSMEQMRREPLARDSSGLLYWYLDYHTTTGTRLYRETPSSLVKNKPKGGLTEPQWELLGSSPEELLELGEKLRRSKKKPDQDLANQILDSIVPELLERREADLRKQRAAARMRSQLTHILPDEAGGYGGRSRRVRKEVNYSFEEYDKTIKAALRSGHSNDEHEGRMTRSAAFFDPRMSAEEEAQLGLRRGRSAQGAEPALGLPPNRQPKRSEGNGTSAEPTPAPSSYEPTPPVETDEPRYAAKHNTEYSSEELRRDSEEWGKAESYPDSDNDNVEISELGSREGYSRGESLEAGAEDISSLSEESGDHLKYKDDLNDQDWC